MIEFSTADTSIATVDENGWVYGHKQGITTLTMRSRKDGRRVSCLVAVGPVLDVESALVVRESDGTDTLLAKGSASKYTNYVKDSPAYVRFAITQAQAQGARLHFLTDPKGNYVGYDNSDVFYDAKGFYENGYAYLPVADKLYVGFGQYKVKFYYELVLADGSVVHPINARGTDCYYINPNNY